jgi:hypothetical protein
MLTELSPRYFLILISVANADIHQDISNYNICIGEDTDVVGWHIGKLIEAGYLKGINSSTKTEPYDYICVELTYSGEQFLSKIENNQLWAKIKKYLGVYQHWRQILKFFELSHSLFALVLLPFFSFYIIRCGYCSYYNKNLTIRADSTDAATAIIKLSLRCLRYSFCLFFSKI